MAKRYAKVVAGVIENIGVANAPEDAPGCVEMDDVLDAEIGIGDLYDGVKFVKKPPPVKSLDETKAEKNAEINAARASASAGTFSHGGKMFSADAVSRSDIDGVNGYVATHDALPPGFPGAWKAVDNTYLPIADVAAWKAFYSAMVAQGVTNFLHAQELKAQLAAATTPEEVAAIKW